MLLIKEFLSLVSVVFTWIAVLSLPLVGFLCHWQWRRLAARRKEVERLMVLASEEAARAEVEASSEYSGFSYGSVVEKETEVFEKEEEGRMETEITSPEASKGHWKLQYQCQLCLFPTKTRCSQCKALYYCSAKCQITHWRQGHKDECRPFTLSYQSNAIAESQRGNVFTDSTHPTTADEKDDNEVAHFEGGKISILNKDLGAPSEPAKMTRRKSAVSGFATNLNKSNLSYKRPFVDETKSAFSEDSCSSSLDNYALSSNDDGVKPSSVNFDSHRGSSSLLFPGSGVDECNESFSVPSAPFPGFQGVIDRRKARISSVNATEAADVDDLDPDLRFPSLKLTGKVSSEGQLLKKMLPDDLQPSIPEIRKATNELGPSAEIYTEDLRPQRLSPSGVNPELGDDGDINDEIKKGPTPELSKRQDSLTNSFFQEKTILELKPSSPEVSNVQLSGGTRNQKGEDVRSSKTNADHATSACPSDFLGPLQNSQNSSEASTWKVIGQVKSSKPEQVDNLTENECVGRYNRKGQFQYELFVKLYNWNKLDLRPCGLMNCGNSCYANVVLQCLAFTPPLTAYFLQRLHSQACPKRDWCFTCELEWLVLKAKEGDSPLSPSRIISQIQKVGSHLGNGREEDAHEFLRYSIDAMQSVCLKAAGVGASNSLEETTLLGLTFGGYLRSKIECMRCGGKSECQEKIMDLNVEIEGNIQTLEEALGHFTRTEILDGENKYKCARCKSYEKARKKLRVLEAPNILTIALKRFQSGKFGKLNKTINFPEILNMAPYMSGTSDKSPVYRLYGIVVHLDIMNAAYSGHYICYVKTSQNRWFKIDDSQVTAVDMDTAFREGAYMLLYARCSPRAPRSLRTSVNPNDLRKAKDSECNNPRNTSREEHDASRSDFSSKQCFSSNASLHPYQTTLEWDYLSDNISSLFSEVHTCSTDSSSGDSVRTNDYHDQIYRDIGACLISPQRNSDSETSSSSTSLSSEPAKHSPRNDLKHYTSRFSETRVSHPDANKSNVMAGEGIGRPQILCSDLSKPLRMLGGGGTCCRGIGCSKLGYVNSLEDFKSSVHLRQSLQERCT